MITHVLLASCSRLITILLILKEQHAISSDIDVVWMRDLYHDVVVSLRSLINIDI